MNPIKQLHAHTIVTGLYRYPFPIAKVLTSYALSAAHLSDARQVFEQIQEPSAFVWNTMIRGLAQNDTPTDAIVFYNRMRNKGPVQDNMTFPFVLKACARVPAIRDGWRVHSHSLKLGLVPDIFVSNALINLYASCGDLGCARLVFDEMPVRDLFSWNSLICGFSRNNSLKDVLGLFEAMQVEDVKADKVTMVQVVSACTHLGEWDLAESAIRYIEENQVEVDVYLGNTLIDFYGRRGSVESAQRVFHEMKARNILTFNAMITSYAKAGDLASARKIFDEMPDRDLISWSSMITGYSQANRFSDALVFFQKMHKAKVKPDEIVIVSVLSACAHLGALDLGKWIHQYIRKNNIKEEDIYVGNSLIHMYAKCGCVMSAFKVFREMKEKDTISWNSIILGLASNGYAETALEIFSDMLNQGFQPDDVSFLGVLIACAYSGLVDKGLEYFESMKEAHHVEPQMKHYRCVVDLLGRAGELDKAHKFITEMPLKPGPIIWRILLGACMVHGNVDLAEIAIKELYELDPSNSGNYVLLSNTYAGADRWKEAMVMREMMTESDVPKTPGCSSIEVSNLADEFIDANVPLSRKKQVVVA